MEREVVWLLADCHKILELKLFERIFFRGQLRGFFSFLQFLEQKRYFGLLGLSSKEKLLKTTVKDRLMHGDVFGVGKRLPYSGNVVVLVLVRLVVERLSLNFALSYQL